MRSGPKAIKYQSTLFRTSELVWVKVAPLPPWRQAIRWTLIGCGLAFFFVMASAKGSWQNVEGLLGLLAWHVGYWLQSEVRLASSGDLPESYQERGGEGQSKTFRGWVSALSEGENECKVVSRHYQHWFNLDRIAWIRSCIVIEPYPLILLPVFLGYLWLIQQNFDIDPNLPVLSDVRFLTFEGSTAFLHFLCWLISFLGLAGTLTSLSAGVEVRASGGLSDRFALSRRECQLLMDRLAGLSEPAPVVASPPVTAPPAPVEVQKPAAPPPAPPPPPKSDPDPEPVVECSTTP